MSKLIPFLFAGVGASSVSVGGVFMLKKTGGGGSGTGNTNSEGGSAQTEPLKLYEAVDAFKNAKGDKCVHELFSGELDMNNTSSTSFPADYFGTNPTDEAAGKNTIGCLIINGKKATKESKGTGTFTWSGSFKNQKKGFIIFGVAKTNNTSKKLDLTGLTYLLEEDASSKWTIKHGKTSSANSSVNDADQDFDKKFPKAKASVDEFKKEKDHWGFIDNKDSLKEICDKDCESGSPTITPKGFKWDGKKGGGSHSISDWCENLDGWGKLFGDTSFSLSTKLSGFTGTGTKK